VVQATAGFRCCSMLDALDPPRLTTVVKVSTEVTMTPKRKLVVSAAGVLCLALLLGGVLLLIPPARPALHFGILGRTNDSSGATKTLVSVVNNTGRTQNYTYWAQVQTASGWTEAKNWEAQRPGQLHWIRGHDTNRFALPAPEGASTWRLKFMRMPQPSALEWKWYAVVRQTGLRRVGLQDRPPQSYSFTDQVTE
jgi:hypothetical protein